MRYCTVLNIILLCIAGFSAGLDHPKKVVIIGGGVAGLSAAHELGERGFQVEVYERNSLFGGKARSYGANGTSSGDRQGLPSEHGFRIFWGYYNHIFDLLKRIPSENSTVYKHLVPIYEFGDYSEVDPNTFAILNPQTLSQYWSMIMNYTEFWGQFTFSDLEIASQKMLIIHTTCEQRLYEEFDQYSFAQFMPRGKFSEKFVHYLMDAPHFGSFTSSSASLFATANWLSMVTSETPSLIRVLDRPTNEAWIDPWVEYMTKKFQVQFHLDTSLESINLDGDGLVSNLTLLDITQNKPFVITSDYYLIAIPNTDLDPIVTERISKSAPSLSHLDELQDTWMNGIQFFLHKDIQIDRGFVLYIDTPWDLTSVSQTQFWKNVNMSNYGDGSTQGVLSVIISNFTAPGVVYKKSAKECTKEEISKEVWEQLKQSCNKDGKVMLEDSNLDFVSVDTSLKFHEGQSLINTEPIFISTVGSLQIRPKASTEIPNLFVAADYVLTKTTVTPTTMEAANEAARRAVNAIIVQSGSTAPPCSLFDPPRSQIFSELRDYDCARYKQGLPHFLCKEKGCVDQ